MHIPFLDLDAQYRSIQEEMDSAIFGVIHKYDFISGTGLALFEKEFAHAQGVQYCIGTSSGTTALHLAYEMIGLGPGDEVIVPTMTFIATTEPLRQVGAIPVFCDIEEHSYNIDASKIEELITPRTKAIVVVHLHGNPADMDEIMAIANKYGLKVIEDCAQAHLAEYKGKKVGNFGDIAAFSFYPGKNLGAYGDAGAVVTNNQEYYTRMRLLVNHGRTEKYIHEVEGYNYRMDTLQAAVLNVKLKYLEQWTESRSQKAKLYNELLTNSQITTPQIIPDKKHAFHIYSVVTDNRDIMIKKLKDHKIASGIHYPLPLHLQPAYQHLKKQLLPTAERLSKQFLSLPLYAELKDEFIEAIVSIIR